MVLQCVHVSIYFTLCLKHTEASIRTAYVDAIQVTSVNIVNHS